MKKQLLLMWPLRSLIDWATSNQIRNQLIIPVVLQLAARSNTRGRIVSSTLSHSAACSCGPLVNASAYIGREARHQSRSIHLDKYYLIHHRKMTPRPKDLSNRKKLLPILNPKHHAISAKLHFNSTYHIPISKEEADYITIRKQSETAEMDSRQQEQKQLFDATMNATITNLSKVELGPNYRNPAA